MWSEVWFALGCNCSCQWRLKLQTSVLRRWWKKVHDVAFSMLQPPETAGGTLRAYILSLPRYPGTRSFAAILPDVLA